MKFDEWKILVKGLKSVYTSDRFLPDGDSVRIWYSLLKDIPYETLNIAIQKYMATGKFPPTVAELRESACEITSPDLKEDWSAGWQQVVKAIGGYGCYNAEGALESMDSITRQCVKRLGWKNLCMSENQMADRANFRQIYEQVKTQQKGNAQLPAGLRKAISAERQMIAEESESGGHSDAE
jgi:hypothetical protein